MQNTFYPYNPKLKELARELRKNLTLGEVILWQKIRRRQLGYQFHRQIPISEFIVDFYCHELHLAIEVDGGSHDHPEVAVNDLQRQNEIEDFGIRFLRFEEKEIRKDIDAVVELIEHWIELKS
jgi:very-short-patch-repair endonuclease